MKQSDHQDLDKQLSEIIDYCAESYYPEHEYGDIWEDRNAEYLKDAVEQIKSLIQSEITKARIDEWNLISETQHSAMITAELYFNKSRNERIATLNKDKE